MTADSAASLTPEQLALAFEQFARASDALTRSYEALQARARMLSERLEVLLQALPAGVLVLDAQDRVVQANRAAKALWPGLEPEGRAWAELAATLRPTDTPQEVELPLPDGSARRLDLSWADLAAHGGRLLLLHDVTEAHRLRQAMERNLRLAAMGEMVAALAHQLRTPLAAAMLYVGNLAAGELPPERRAQLAERAQERLRHLERLIGDMLLFARGEGGARRPVALEPLARETLHALEPLAAAKRARLEGAVEPLAGAWVQGDAKALAGALTNLLENALQAISEGGTVRLEGEREGDRVHLVVRDEGPGIAADTLERIFEPFFTTRSEGTGLGLAIARGVARAHGGDIEAFSRPGEGSRFVLSLPLSPPPMEDA
jgi:two-component system sensor histidine kinase FlrB